MEYITLASQEGISNHLLDPLIDKQNNFLATFRQVPIKNVKQLPNNIPLPNSNGYDMPVDQYTWLITQRMPETRQKFISYIDTIIVHHVFIYTNLKNVKPHYESN